MTPRQAKRVALESIVAVVEDDMGTWTSGNGAAGGIDTPGELAMVKREAAAVLTVIRRRAARLRSFGNEGRR
jgi:hypothetical protein